MHGCTQMANATPALGSPSPVIRLLYQQRATIPRGSPALRNFGVMWDPVIGESSKLRRVLPQKNPIPPV
jgi:hypothetical protein